MHVAPIDILLIVIYCAFVLAIGLVILPGIAALALTLHPTPGTAPLLPTLADGTYDYNMALPLMMSRYYPAGLLGLGLTALLASFMSGMAGNVTAFNTVWTFDI